MAVESVAARDDEPACLDDGADAWAAVESEQSLGCGGYAEVRDPYCFAVDAGCDCR